MNMNFKLQIKNWTAYDTRIKTRIAGVQIMALTTPFLFTAIAINKSHIMKLSTQC
jgi:hypothetical protein